MRDNLRLYVTYVLGILAAADLVAALFSLRQWLGWSYSPFFSHAWWRAPLHEWYWTVGFMSLFFAIVALASLTFPKPKIRRETPMDDDSHILRIDD